MNDLCSIELLKRALARDLSAEGEAGLRAHLERCEACCAEMERLAGGEAWQQEAAALLIADELDQAVSEAAVWSEADFTVEHLDPSDDPDVLGRIGGYDVLAVVGRGGMGVVLKAFDRELKRFVAIKALAPHLAHSSIARKRFAREAQAAAAVVNPHVIAIHHVQPTGRLPFLIMPLLAGESLAQRLKARGPLELTEVLRIGTQTAAGLAAAHDQGLVHRDVKPANVFLDMGVERVVITDFGLARAADDVSLTRLGVVAGTPEYMSPEQARGEGVDGRSDLFSLGSVLYEMATGVSPFRAVSTLATLRRIVDEQPAAMATLDPKLPPWFCEIVERLLSKDPACRYETAGEVSQLLGQCLSHLQQPAAVPLPASLAARDIRRRSTLALPALGAVALLGTIFMTWLGIAQMRQVMEAPHIARDLLEARNWEHAVARSVEDHPIAESTAAAPARSHFPGMTPEIADAILDWTDEDDEQRPLGAESETYRQFESPYAPSNRPLTHMEELLCIRGVTPELVYGADANRNGRIDGGEDATSISALGWAGLIRDDLTASSTRHGHKVSDVDRVLFALAPDNDRAVKFADLDADRDGRLSLDEFGVGRKMMYAAKWFGLRDANRDGSLSLEEFLPLSASSVSSVADNRPTSEKAQPTPPQNVRAGRPDR